MDFFSDDGVFLSLYHLQTSQKKIDPYYEKLQPVARAGIPFSITIKLRLITLPFLLSTSNENCVNIPRASGPKLGLKSNRSSVRLYSSSLFPAPRHKLTHNLHGLCDYGPPCTMICA